MKQIFNLSFFLCIPWFANAQTEMDTVWLKNAQVFAIKSQLLLDTHFADSLYYKNGFAWSTSDWLLKQNLTYAKNYGAAGIQTAGIRGLSAAQTAVLWNGVPMNNAMLGVTDLSLVKGFFIDEMALSLGSSSALFGNAAVGGTIQLNNQLKDKKSLQIVSSVNSMQQYNFGVKMAYQLAKNTIAETRILAMTNKNRFSYTNSYKPANPTETMNHALEKSIGILQQFNISLKNNWQWKHRVWAQLQIRQLPPSMAQKESTAAMEDNFLRYQTEFSKTISNHKTTYKLALNNEQNIYSDTVASTYNNNKVQSYFGSMQHDWNSKHGLFSLQSVYYSAIGESKNYIKTASQSYLNLSGKYAFFTPRAKGQISAAFLTAKGGYNPVTAFVSLNYALTPKWTFYLASGNSFRLPTLNERFWSPGGNENIKPEESIHLEIGINKQTKLWGIKNHVYITPTKNLVVWLPAANNVVVPHNLSSKYTLLCGNEFSANQTLINKKWRWVIIESYHLNFARASWIDFGQQEQLPYVPLHRASIEIRVLYKSFTLWYLHQYQSARNTDFSNLEKLNWYTLGNLVFQWDHKQFTTGLHLNNLYNVQYQLMAVRPMPGFNAQINFTYHLIYKK